MNKIYGLVVCGGQSSRMGVDKSMLNYHGQQQRYHLYEMLSGICAKVFISCNKNQAIDIPENYELIVDSEKYQNTGPMAALLSAFDMYPDAAFLVIGCDYPFIKRGDLLKLIEIENQIEVAFCYYNKKEQIKEPMLALYLPACYHLLVSNFKKGNNSLRHFLNEINAKNILPDNADIIKSVDTLEGFENALKLLNRIS
jgi:molybdopterin-guanine dinucleotide biosynthesis protein A